MNTKYAPDLYTIPMPGHFHRSLNLANSVAVAVYEGLRRLRPDLQSAGNGKTT